MTNLCMPGDKSISHRALILASLAAGPCRISGLSDSRDAGATLAALRALGTEVAPPGGGKVLVQAPSRWSRRPVELDCGNSGTTARLLAGLLTGLGAPAVLRGDASLERRPMDRVVYPLQSMGGKIEYLARRDRLPVRIEARTSGSLRILRYRGRVASAQVKSSLLLAGLAGGTEVEVREPRQSRDHTERMLRGLGAPVSFGELEDGSARAALSADVAMWQVPAFDFDVPGDVSSAAFMLAAGLLSGRPVRIEGVALNPTRTAFLDVLREMGAQISTEPTAEQLGEPVGNLELSPGPLTGFEIDSTRAAAVIDEIPVLSVLATQAEGTSRITGALELRYKESDRISAVVSNLRAIGVEAEESPDGLQVLGARGPLSGSVRSGGDHRIAMAFAVLGCVPGSAIAVDDLDCVAVSYPGFPADLVRIAPEVGE
jgi:3-phosphoshikimate 1-carboxyvinyltransferase